LFVGVRGQTAPTTEYRAKDRLAIYLCESSKTFDGWMPVGSRDRICRSVTVAQIHTQNAIPATGSEISVVIILPIGESGGKHFFGESRAAVDSADDSS
jgi:hypothetical protein